MNRLEWLCRVLSLVSAVGSCQPLPHPEPIPPPVPGATCADAGAKLRAIGCPEARTPHGTPFEEACERAAADGRDFCPGDVAAITDCSEVEAASRRCLQ
jgi:hypothetical protein